MRNGEKQEKRKRKKENRRVVRERDIEKGYRN